MKNLIIVRGGGDIATGTIYKLVRSGFPVLILETSAPSAIRRNVAFSEAVYEGSATVEGMTCRLAHSADEAREIMQHGMPAILVDPKADALRTFSPIVLIDAILAKKNLGTTIGMAPLTIALGPGFCADCDVNVVVETKRGHNLGKLIYSGQAAPDTGIPGDIAGYSKERVIHAPAAGIFRPLKKLTDTVTAGEEIAYIETPNETVPITAPISGLLRGLLRDGYAVTAGFKSADIDPRLTEYENCFTISDKARCIAGGVLEAVMHSIAALPAPYPSTEKINGGTKEETTDTADEEVSDTSSPAPHIYADCAATSLPKPPSVIQAVTDALLTSGSSGRGVHSASLHASRTVFLCRQALNTLFHAPEPEQVIFTSNATTALNLLLKGCLTQGDHVITTVMEHNSVLRPLYELETSGEISLTILPCEADGTLALSELQKAVTPQTKAFVCTHASNVTGNLNNIHTIGQFCQKNNILFFLDASQTAGIFPIDMEKDCIDALVFTGHKSLLGPQGTGGLCLQKKVTVRPLITGGSGILSFSAEHPSQLPEALEAGTHNSHGIAGLLAGISFIQETGIDTIRQKEKHLCRCFYDRVRLLPGVTVYGNFSDAERAPIVSLNIWDIDSAAVSDELENRFGISTRSGAHCAPLMHRHFHTEKQGMVRFSFSFQNTEAELDAILKALQIIIEECTPQQ